ncbi:IclR family transcriptional regulator [Agromyces protaetiae]|uniref:IclR family transcriptional regulator n=1 Tax=Agromyces protaetiae TaxID=2509455 RepID=UPI0013EB1DE6|nr:IclR family transcriptional regulator C-terminal domain-containing protein [Agromyces protaetiae]
MQLVATEPVRRELASLRDAAGAPAYLTVFRGDDIAVAHIADSREHPRIGQLHVGFSEASHTTAFGKLMLASRDDQAVARFLERRGARRLTAASITDASALVAQLDEVRAQQLAVEIEEYLPKLACIAAPVRSAAGRTVGAVSVSVQAKDFSARARELEQAVRRGAWRVSAQLA